MNTLLGGYIMGRPKKAKGPIIKKSDKSVPRPEGKKGIKPSARVEEDQYIAYNYKGIKMSIKERDQRMKLEYIRGMSCKEIAERYGIQPKRVEEIRSRDKWVKAKRDFDNDRALVTDDTLTQLYAGFKVSVNIKYHAAWEKLMSIVEMCLDEPDRYLFTKEGNIRWGALDVLSNLIDKAQKGQERANGMLPEEVRYRLQVEREKITLLREQMGDREVEGEIRDNFVEALDKAAQSVWKDFAKETGSYIKGVSDKGE